MTTGHVNPGYEKVVSSCNLALDNPTGSRLPFRVDKEELEAIKLKARSVWATKDNFETTYGFHYREPQIKQPAGLRPSSPSRRNNPHPKLVFLSARLKNLPGYFDPNPENVEEGQESVEQIKLTRALSARSKPPSVQIYHNANHYLNSLPNEEVHSEEAKLKDLGVDTRSNNIKLSPPGKTVTFSQQFPDGRFKSESYIDMTPTSRTNRLMQLQSNQTNPYLYEDTRMYKEKYANGDHGIPWNPPRRPFRGDFVIHPDWHPGLKHHRLPYM